MYKLIKPIIKTLETALLYIIIIIIIYIMKLNFLDYIASNNQHLMKNEPESLWNEVAMG
jgi:hypothetical protein